MQRKVEVSQDLKSIIGAWQVNSQDCPLLPHLKALGKQPQDCASGIETNVQGPVVLKTCEHYAKDSIWEDGGILVINCQKGTE